MTLFLAALCVLYLTPPVWLGSMVAVRHRGEHIQTGWLAHGLHMASSHKNKGNCALLWTLLLQRGKLVPEKFRKDME
jgi:hypothetical protein